MEKIEDKVWGLYCPYGKAEWIDTLNELELYWELLNTPKNVGGWFAAGVPFEEILERCYYIQYLRYYTRKFGVEFDNEPTANERAQSTKGNNTFHKWDDYWTNFFFTLTEEELEECKEALDKKEDVTRFLPTRRWNDPVEEEHKPTR